MARRREASSSVVFAARPPPLLLLLAIISTTVSIANGQPPFLDNGAIGNIYVGKFEEVCATPLTEYSDCLDRNDGSSSSCFDENLDLLTCAGNCPAEFQASWFCISSPGALCTTELAAWIGCATDYCANTYLPDYAQCVALAQENSGACSTCPNIFLASDDTPISKPVCSDLDTKYCEWQSCCEPCQYLLNLYGRCMQVNFNVCNQQGITSLANCPFVIPTAAPIPLVTAPTSSPQGVVVPDGEGGDGNMSSSPMPRTTSSSAAPGPTSPFFFPMIILFGFCLG